MRKTLVNPLISLYGWINRQKVFDWAPLQLLFVHSYFFYKNHLEDPFSSLISKRPELFTRGHLLDVGANIGYTAIVFARALKVEHNVFAFEPEATNFDRLRKNLARFGVNNRVVVNRVAVGSQNGSIEIWVNELHHGDHRIVTGAFSNKIRKTDSVQRVPMVSIDSFVASNHISTQIGFIKVDVQGYETEVCRGMEHTLENNPRAVVAIEYAPGSMVELGFEAEDLIEFFVERGFYLYELGRQGLRALPVNQLQLEQDEWINLLCSRERL